MNETRTMNGTNEKSQHLLLISDKKPIVTYAGDHDLFLSLQQILASSLPSEPAEWRRSYGRAVKSVNVSASFVPFTKDALPKESQFHLFDQPMFHTYWTQCPDVDMYKATVKEDIETWMRILTQYSMSDWMIVLVETYDFRKSSKLIPRTTVFDKIKSDFGTKHADRCLSVINPLRSESRAAGSWRGLVVNFRLLLLTAYDRTLLKFEETIRDQRDKRNKPGWSFTKYFLLQEELAFVLEMLGVYEEALVQYDELDAMFTQFVLNSNLGESPAWLAQFQGSLDSWDGLSITNGVNLKERNRIENNTASLLHFRNYLFSRQCAMLLCANKPAEVAQRTLPNLHNCIKELSLLEVSFPPGAVACWVLLSCIEILETCEKYKEGTQVEQCSKFTAGIWAYARQKLSELGELCGLCPGQKQTSEQLHISVQIFAGLKEDFSVPVEKLKKALSSQQEFTSFYLELSELAMGTYKHIKRMRYAKSLGFDLVKFYWAVEDYTSATSFLLNALHCYEQDGWKQLAAKTKLHLAYSYLQMGDALRYAKTCLAIAATPELDMSIRLEYLEKMTQAVKENNPDPPAWVGVMNDCLTITDISVQVAQGSSEATACIEFVSNLPVDVVCPLISMAVIPYKSDKTSSKVRTVDPERKAKDKLTPGNPLHQRIPVSMRYEYKQNKLLAMAAIECDEKYFRSSVRRTDSQGKYRKVSTVSKLDFTKSLTAKNVTIKSGINVLQLTSSDNTPGYYRLGQISVLMKDNFELLSTPPQQKITYEVVHTLPTISLSATSELLAGLPQTAILQIATLGYHVNEGSVLELTSGTGLQLTQSQNDDEVMDIGLRVKLPEIQPFSTFNKPIIIFAALPPHKEMNSLLHDVIIKTPWSQEPELISLQLQPALCAHLRLHSARMNKFLVITLTTLNGHVSLSLHDPSLVVRGQEGVTVTPSNPPDVPMELSHDRKVNFMWKLEAPLYNSESFPIETEFSVCYEPLEEDACEPLLYKCVFNISSFMTLYIVDCKVEPVRGSEFCRVSTVCQLTIKVAKIHVNSSECSLMYEVFAEHNMWAVCGKAAGVLLWEEKVNEQTVTVDIMPLINGYLPLPTVKLSKYIPANPKAQSNRRKFFKTLHVNGRHSLTSLSKTRSVKKMKPVNCDSDVRSENHPRLEQFSAGQIYNASKGSQVHVIAAASPQDL